MVTPGVGSTRPWQVSDLLGTSKAKLRLVTEDEMVADFSQFELGAIPPLGEMLPLPRSSTADCSITTGRRATAASTPTPL